MSAEITRYRSTEVTFDGHLPEVVQEWFAYERRADAMAKGRTAEKSNVVLLPGAGWVLKPYIFDPGKTHETSAGEGGIQSVGAGLMQVAASVAEFDTFRDPSLTGVTLSGAASGGSPMWQKRLSAGANWNSALDEDQKAYPSPNTSEDVAPMDRVAKTSGNFYPDDAVLLRFYVPGSPVTASGPLVTLYFTGPAGDDDAATGCGQYALKLNGDGLAVVYERKVGVLSSSMWQKRHSFRWCPPQAVYAAMHSIAVGSDTVHLSSPDRYVGRRIYFRTSMGPTTRSNTLLENLIVAAVDAIDSRSGFFDSVYDVPRLTQAATEVAPVRIDARRDVRVIAQVQKATYPTSGSLTDDVFSLSFFPTTDELFYVEWYATTPSGCAVDVKMYDADTDVELSNGTVTISDELGGQKTYTPNDRQRNYYLKATLTGDGSKTPLLTEVRLFRNPVVETSPATTPKTFPTARTGLPKDAIRTVNVSGPGDDPSHETMSLTVQDFVGGLDFLKVRSGMPVVVKTTYDANGSNKSVLFRGFVQNARGSKKFGGGRNYPDPWAYEWDVSAVGQWRRLQEHLAPKRFVWFDQSAGAPYKVTDAITLLIKSTGVPAADIDVADLPLRLFSQDGQDLVLEPGTPISDVIVRLAFDYLGAYIVFDANAGTNGKWRLLQAKEAPYNVLARFEHAHPGNGKVYADGAYADDTDTSPGGNTQTIKRTFIRRKTLEHWVEPPEGNIVSVFGGARNAGAQAQGHQGFALLTQVLVNVAGYDFLNLGSAHAKYPDVEGADYLGRMVPIQVYDPSLSTQEAVDWVCKRIYRAACFSHKYLSFEAPLILVTDADDAEQTNPRPLRFYDIVEVRNEANDGYDKYIVASCSPAYTRDKVQMARYTLVTTSNLEQFASVQINEGLGRWRRAENYAAKRREGKTGRSPLGANSQAQARNAFADWMEQPEKGSAAIQDLDPASDTFGDVYWTLDFDPLS